MAWGEATRHLPWEGSEKCPAGCRPGPQPGCVVWSLGSSDTVPYKQGTERRRGHMEGGALWITPARQGSDQPWLNSHPSMRCAP